ncbi:MAG TPA: hypothetical protein VN738_05115 [Acidothermaceae bacterium]|nr:hypothetical protein [Acidothermaceae bacterium]
MRVRAVLYLDVDAEAVARAFGIDDPEFVPEVVRDHAQMLVEGDLAAKGLAS